MRLGNCLLVSRAFLACISVAACTNSTDFAKMATDANAHAMAEVESSDTQPMKGHADAAMRYLEPVLAHPDLLHLIYKQEISFDSTPPTLSTVSPGDILHTSERIAEIYEQSEMWEKACDVRRRAIEFATTWSKTHATDASLNQAVKYRFQPTVFVKMYTDYARCAFRSGNKQLSRELSTTALHNAATYTSTSNMQDSHNQMLGGEYDELGVVALERGDSPADVQPIFAQAVSLTDRKSSLHGDALLHFGDVLMAQKEYAKAEENFQAALEIISNDNNYERTLDATAHLAKCYWLEGKKHQARELLESVINKQNRPEISRNFAKHLVELAFYYAHDGKRQLANDVLQRVKQRITYLDQVVSTMNHGSINVWRLEAQKLRRDVQMIADNTDVQIDQLQTCSPGFEYYRI